MRIIILLVLILIALPQIGRADYSETKIRLFCDAQKNFLVMQTGISWNDEAPGWVPLPRDLVGDLPAELGASTKAECTLRNGHQVVMKEGGPRWNWYGPCGGSVNIWLDQKKIIDEAPYLSSCMQRPLMAVVVKNDVVTICAKGQDEPVCAPFADIPYRTTPDYGTYPIGGAPTQVGDAHVRYSALPTGRCEKISRQLAVAEGEGENYKADFFGDGNIKDIFVVINRSHAFYGDVLLIVNPENGPPDISSKENIDTYLLKATEVEGLAEIKLAGEDTLFGDRYVFMATTRIDGKYYVGVVPYYPPDAITGSGPFYTKIIYEAEPSEVLRTVCIFDRV